MARLILIQIYRGICKLIVADISLDANNDRSQLIFESLNSTGLHELSPPFWKTAWNTTIMLQGRTSLPLPSCVFIRPRLKTCIYNIVRVHVIVTLHRQVCLIWECNLPNLEYNSIYWYLVDSILTIWLHRMTRRADLTSSRSGTAARQGLRSFPVFFL